MSLQTLPVEVLANVLEQVCRQIVNDLTTSDSKRKPTNSYAKLLNQFLQLRLVSRSFHAVLTHYVRVDGKSIRNQLLEPDAETHHFC